MSETLSSTKRPARLSMDARGYRFNGAERSGQTLQGMLPKKNWVLSTRSRRAIDVSSGERRTERY